MGREGERVGGGALGTQKCAPPLLPPPLLSSDAERPLPDSGEGVKKWRHSLLPRPYFSLSLSKFPVPPPLTCTLRDRARLRACKIRLGASSE